MKGACSANEETLTQLYKLCLFYWVVASWKFSTPVQTSSLDWATLWGTNIVVSESDEWFLEGEDLVYGLALDIIHDGLERRAHCHYYHVLIEHHVEREQVEEERAEQTDMQNIMIQNN